MDLFNVYPLYDLEPVSGKGCYVFDRNGKSYLDFYGGHAVISIGHSHPFYIKRITDQLNQLAFYSNSVQNRLQQDLAKKLGRLSGCDDYRLFLCNSGAEAIENALKIASWHTGKTKVLAFKQGFHGRTSAAVRITDKASIQAPINQGFEVEYHQLNDLQSVQSSIGRADLAAVVVEGIQGIGGIHVPDPKFLQELELLCRRHDVPLILDEIQSGYGRSGRFFAFQHAGIQPDLITVAKGMGNGFPIGAVLIHPRFKASFGMLGSTFGGNHLACAAALAVLEVMKKEYLVENAETLGGYLLRQLTQIEGINQIRGKGLMIGVEYDFPVAELREKLLYEEEVFVGSSSEPNVLRVLPPLAITKMDIDIFIKKLKKVSHQLTRKQRLARTSA